MLCAPFVLANLRESATGYTRPDECSAEADVFRGVPLAMQIGEYAAIAALGTFQTLSSLFISCFCELDVMFRCLVGELRESSVFDYRHTQCLHSSPFAAPITNEHVSSGRYPGVSEFFHNRWHMYGMYVLGGVQFLLFLYLAVVPHLPYMGAFSLVGV